MIEITSIFELFLAIIGLLIFTIIYCYCIDNFPSFSDYLRIFWISASYLFLIFLWSFNEFRDRYGAGNYNDFKMYSLFLSLYLALISQIFY